MNRYLTIHIPETSAPAPVSHFLRTQADLTKKQISQAKFRPGGVQKNGQQCRVTETAYPGDQITVCLETDNVDSVQLESAPTSLFLPELTLLYEDQDILAVNKPAGIVTHPSGSHYSDSLSNQIAAYFRSKGEPTKVRSIGRLDKETSGILLFARNQTAAARLQKQRENGISEKTYLAAVSGSMPEDTDGASENGNLPGRFPSREQTGGNFIFRTEIHCPRFQDLCFPCNAPPENRPHPSDPCPHGISGASASW